VIVLIKICWRSCDDIFECQKEVPHLSRRRYPMIKCPYCGSSDFYKNGHSHNGSQQYLCKSCHKTFSLHSFNKPKLFSFIYPKCPVCGKSMQIYKIRRGFIRFRCRTCKTKININRFLPPEPVSSSISSFSSHVHPYFVFLAIYLYFKRNLSFCAIADALPIHVSCPYLQMGYQVQLPSYLLLCLLS